MNSSGALILTGCALFGTSASNDSQPEPAVSPVIRLLEKQSDVLPGKHADVLVQEGKIEVETPRANAVEVRMTGAVAAHTWMGFESAGIQTFRLVQEFEVASPEHPGMAVELALKGGLKGYLRSCHKGSAAIRSAVATVAPPGGATPLLALRLPTFCVVGKAGAGAARRKLSQS